MLDAEGCGVFGAIDQKMCRRIRRRRADDTALEKAQHSYRLRRRARPGGTLSDIGQIKHWRAPRRPPYATQR